MDIESSIDWWEDNGKIISEWEISEEPGHDLTVEVRLELTVTEEILFWELFSVFVPIVNAPNAIAEIARLPNAAAPNATAPIVRAATKP